MLANHAQLTFGRVGPALVTALLPPVAHNQDVGVLGAVVEAVGEIERHRHEPVGMIFADLLAVRERLDGVEIELAELLGLEKVEGACIGVFVRCRRGWCRGSGSGRGSGSRHGSSVGLAATSRVGAHVVCGGVGRRNLLRRRRRRW